MYDHPQVQDMKYQEYAALVESMRHRRLIVAIEHETVRQKRHAAMLSQFRDKWVRKDEQLAKKIEHLRLELERADKMLNDMSELNHKIHLLEE